MSPTLLQNDKDFIWRPYTAPSRHRSMQPIEVAEVDGSWLIDSYGKRYLDGSGSWWTSNLGLSHPRIKEALVRQANRFAHASFAEATHQPAVALAEELLQMAPKMARVFYSDNGSTAVEVGLKMAMQYWHVLGETNRKRIIALPGAYHGDTFGAMAVGDIAAFNKTFKNWLFDVEHPPIDPQNEEDWAKVFAWIEAELAEDSGSIAAVIVEPMVQGAAGMRMYDVTHLAALRAACDSNGALLIADEVFTGFGRTLEFWACDHAGISPDIIASAKGLSGGALPFSATLANARVYDAFGDNALMHGHTFYGNPLGAAVAREVLAIYRDEAILKNAAPKAKMVKDAFTAFSDLGLKHRSCGMVAAVDLGPSDYHGEAGWRVHELAKAKGILLRPLGNTVYIVPALNVPDGDLKTLLEVTVSSVLQALKL